MHFDWKMDALAFKQTGIFVLPFMAMRLRLGILQMCFKVGCFMQENPKEKMGRKVSVNADFMKLVIGLRPAIVAQLADALASDMKMDFILVQIVINPLDSRKRQVVI